MNCPTIAELLPNGNYRHTCPLCGFSDDTITTPLYYRYCGTLPAIEIKRPDSGPGTELTALLKELCITPTKQCGCEQKAYKMDLWGPEVCRQQRHTIIAWLKEATKHVTWSDCFKAGLKMLGQDWLRISDPIGSLVDESIRRAEARHQDANS